MRKTILFTFAILTLLAGSAMALENLPAATGTLTSQSGTTIVVDTADGPETFLTGEATKWIDPVETGDTVLVRYDPDDNQAVEVFKVYENIEVTENLAGERHAIFGTVTATGKDGLIIESARGQAFVINPEQLFPPLPAPQDKVALTYRVEDLAEGEQAIATDLAVLPDDFVLPTPGSVEISSEPIEQPEEETTVAETETMVEPTPAPAPEPMPEPETTETETTQMASLPATASPLPLMALLGALSLSGGVALRRREKK